MSETTTQPVQSQAIQSQPVEQQPQQPQPQPGAVIFSRSDASPAPDSRVTSVQQVEQVDVTAAQREAVVFTEYDLDVHLTPASAQMETRARMTVRNDGATPLAVLVLQISSSLLWESVSVQGAAGAAVQQLVDTDADHTGKVREAIVRLTKPLAPGATTRVEAFYSGTIAQDATRLERIGAPPEQGKLADWDEIAASGTALRGFGSVLWYPVAAAPAFLGEGAKLFDAVGRMKLREQTAVVRLRLSVAYVGDAPDAVFFCGRRQSLKAVSENEDVPTGEAPGVASVTFDAAPLGFRVPSLFITDRAATQTDAMRLAVVTDHYDALPMYAGASDAVRPLLTDWLGPQALMPLNILDHAGQPFEDDAFLVRPVRAESVENLAPQMAHSLAHAWFRSRRVWLDEGVAEFMTLLWTERSRGRDAALASLAQGDTSLAFIEPAPEPGQPATAGQPLNEASSEVYFRVKAAAVLWMLRSVAGDEALKQALTNYRASAVLDADPMGFEHALERTAHTDLRWLFDDWVYRDRGLPDLTIVNVAPRQTERTGNKAAGFLVAIEVRNDGSAVAEVPVTVRSGSLTATERLRIAPHASAATRILFQGVPEEVLVNDGSVPELRQSEHRQGIKLAP